MHGHQLKRNGMCAEGGEWAKAARPQSLRKSTFSKKENWIMHCMYSIFQLESMTDIPLFLACGLESLDASCCYVISFVVVVITFNSTRETRGKKGRKSGLQIAIRVHSMCDALSTILEHVCLMEDVVCQNGRVLWPGFEFLGETFLISAQLGWRKVQASFHTEPRKKVGTWLRDISSWPCLAFLPGPACCLAKFANLFLSPV